MKRRTANLALGLALSFSLLASLAPSPAHAWLGALAKLGSAAGKAGTGAAGKGAAAGGAAIAGAEVANGVGAAGKAAATAGGAADDAARLGATSADDVSRASGLGAAVPDEVRALMNPGKTLADVPDPGTRAWFGLPRQQLTAQDADLMVRDYVALLEGKAAKGPIQSPVKSQTNNKTANVQTTSPTPTPVQLPSNKPASHIPWHAVELLLRAAHVGHSGARQEAQRICADSKQIANNQSAKPPHPACQNTAARPVVAAK
jgi:hypothetical protein